ncbi:LSU ribosomal protein L23P [Desulfacinum infernum DSM 9756]|jgi:large subunit ribosomal protein L23|uniref:Large ribosomal subunit protein uL23 n=1 Tax=Desulfacinum infernum DSM 9756 TaxID=1121391 RepID=A0A1M4VWH5_9BACT|nr:50S ribosomal protein L23 [Desulfacinum infernum]MBC7356996.1 50S ribosomal protein L23 [Desulfacinum sp.]MBZ4658689.1 ribosomal protein [Desulfacinum sp.]SHE73265.1 LSU ribosomal protein L23P [Desulfacinum infernum DSM 9756]
MTDKAYQILKRPLITEKSTAEKELLNKLHFEVDRRANKIEIKEAVERIFKVDVLEVRTIRMKGKTKRVGRWVTRTPDWKKAIVTIKPGQRVEFFEGV